MSTTGEAKNIWYLYQARRVAQQTNAAAGAVKVDITVAAGQVARLVTAYGLNSGTNSLIGQINDEDNARVFLMASAGSAAGTYVTLPNAGTTPTIGVSESLIVGPGAKLSMEQGGAGAQNDTLTVAVTLLLSTPTEPTWSVARSTNPGDVTLAASTISTANTMQAVAI